MNTNKTLVASKKNLLSFKYAQSHENRTPKQSTLMEGREMIFEGKVLKPPHPKKEIGETS